MQYCINKLNWPRLFHSSPLTETSFIKTFFLKINDSHCFLWFSAIHATRWLLWHSDCTKFNFGWGSALEMLEELTTLPWGEGYPSSVPMKASRLGAFHTEVSQLMYCGCAPDRTLHCNSVSHFWNSSCYIKSKCSEVQKPVCCYQTVWTNPTSKLVNVKSMS